MSVSLGSKVVPGSHSSVELYQLQGVLQEILKSYDDDKISDLSDSALKLLEGLSPLDGGGVDDRAIAVQLQGEGINLWNKTVALKSAGAISLHLNAQMRYIASSVMILTTSVNSTAMHLQKQITMAIKTGKAWLECENCTMAERALTIAGECYEQLRSKYPAVAKEHSKLKQFLQLLCFKMEAAVGLLQHETAAGYLQQVKELLHTLESEVMYVCTLCYNIGLNLFNKKEYPHSVTWFKESYEIGRDKPKTDCVRQACTLRLLANTFLEWDGPAYWQKALSAVGLANSEHSHALGLLLKTSILLEYDPSNGIIPHAFEDTLHHPDLTIDMAMTAIKLANQHNRNLSITGISYLTQRYKGTPSLVQIHLLHLDLLLQSKEEAEAMQLVEDIITAHNRGEPLDVKARQQFHLVLWRQACLAYEKSEFKKALSWYNYSLSLFPTHGDKDDNMAKLQRNRASCLLNLKEFEAAGDAIQSAKTHSAHSPQAHFLAFQLALLTNQQDEAVTALNALVESASQESDGDIVTGFISLGAQVAFEHSKRDLAVVALESLIKTSGNTEQIFTAIRCLLRIKLTIMDTNPQNKLSCLRVMLQYLGQAQSLLHSLSSPSAQHSEANWLLKVAWNLALKCTHHHKEMADFFLICHQLVSCLPVDSSVLRRQRTCQLMMAAATVQVARAADSQEEKEAAMRSVLEHVATCHSISQQFGTDAHSHPKDPTPSLLALYEFEAKLLLGHAELPSVLERVVHIPSVEAKTLETIAALCIRSQNTDVAVDVGVDALRAAIHTYCSCVEVDGDHLSRCYHSLVQLVMIREGGGDRGNDGDGWRVFSEILDLLESKAKDKFPEIEVVWFLTRAWNCGIHLYSSLKFKAAEQWCSLGMRFLKHLNQQKSAYEEQMSRIYSEVLQKVQSGHRFI